MISLQGRKAFVTGSASGIGRATGRTLAEAGAHVVVSDINEAGLAETLAAIEAVGGRGEAIRLDVTDKDGIRRVAEDVNGRHGRMDVIVNVAGWDRIEPFMKNDDDFM